MWEWLGSEVGRCAYRYIRYLMQNLIIIKVEIMNNKNLDWLMRILRKQKSPKIVISGFPNCPKYPAILIWLLKTNISKSIILLQKLSVPQIKTIIQFLSLFLSFNLFLEPFHFFIFADCLFLSKLQCQVIYF